MIHAHEILLTLRRQQPWSTYAVHLTTITHWAFFWDCLLLWLCYERVEPYGDHCRWLEIGVLLSWMLLTKFIKLIGHYIRYPVDFLLLPVSILFGYFHGLIKLYAICTIKVVSLALNVTYSLIPELRVSSRVPLVLTYYGLSFTDLEPFTDCLG